MTAGVHCYCYWTIRCHRRLSRKVPYIPAETFWTGVYIDRLQTRLCLACALGKPKYYVMAWLCHTVITLHHKIPLSCCLCTVIYPMSLKVKSNVILDNKAKRTWEQWHQKIGQIGLASQRTKKKRRDLKRSCGRWQKKRKLCLRQREKQMNVWETYDKKKNRNWKDCKRSEEKK